MGGRLPIRRAHLVAAGAFAAFLALALGNAIVRVPWWDEAWFASPAVDLVRTGSMGTHVLDPYGSLPGIDQYTYWVLPLYLVTLAGWFKIVGVGLLAMRALSVVWGLVALASWFFIVKALARSNGVALLALVLCSVDYAFVMSASDGRMDMMAAALAFAACAVFLTLRERHLTAAFVGAHALAAASLFTHPNGVLAFVGVWVLTLSLDCRRLSWPLLLKAAVPYLAAGAVWAVYIQQAPDLFHAQLQSNAEHRFFLATMPRYAFESELVRYLNFYTRGIYLTGDSPELAAIPVIYVLALAGLTFTPGLIRQRGYRTLVLLTGIFFAAFTLLDGHKRYYYLVYMTPMYAAAVAAVTSWHWRRRAVRVAVLLPLLSVLVSFNVAGAVAAARPDDAQAYDSVVAFVDRRAPAPAHVFGSAELAFALGFDGRVVDDFKNVCQTVPRPGLIVINDRRVRSLGTFPQLQALLARGYAPVYSAGNYHVYAPRPAAAP